MPLQVLAQLPCKRTDQVRAKLQKWAVEGEVWKILKTTHSHMVVWHTAYEQRISLLLLWSPRAWWFRNLAAHACCHRHCDDHRWPSRNQAESWGDWKSAWNDKSALYPTVRYHLRLKIWSIPSNLKLRKDIVSYRTAKAFNSKRSAADYLVCSAKWWKNALSLLHWLVDLGNPLDYTSGLLLPALQWKRQSSRSLCQYVRE